ncbi:MAG: methionine adenosyltransferase [Planctomycetota bacterium]|nr:MAG: methionine adenosyltransferase [Planctomycetota bacterium]
MTIFTSESVAEGHPDKLADQVSDAVLDCIIECDRDCRVACETMVTTGLVLVAGEITTECYVDIPKVVRDVVHDIGYTDPETGFHYETCAILTSIDKQSPDIALGVNGRENHEMGAGDQGLMFGYACNETPELMPAPIMYAHKLMIELAKLRRSGEMPYLRPDGKSQVTVEYDDGRPVRIPAIVVSTQHNPDATSERIYEDVKNILVPKVIPEGLLDKDTKYYVNPTGRFVVGGPVADCGMTGRKIIVDTYGGMGGHGGGAFSGKDPSKVDRTASYMARHIAKNIVAAGLADRVELQVAYAIGVADPLSIEVNTYGTGKVDEGKLVEVIREIFPLKPAAMIEYLDLLRPIFKKTAAYGHFGRPEPEFTWEKTNRVEDIKTAVGL